MQQWEYRVVKATFGNSLEAALNDFGFDGWEVISLAAMDGTLTLTGNKLFAVMKRPLPEGAARPVSTSLSGRPAKEVKADDVTGWL